MKANRALHYLEWVDYRKKTKPLCTLDDLPQLRLCILSPKKRAPKNAKNRGKSASYPISVGEEYEVSIFTIAPNGEGVAKIKNYPVFIKHANLNERVKIRITSLTAGTADAEIIA